MDAVALSISFGTTALGILLIAHIRRMKKQREKKQKGKKTKKR